jgi:hypothetical protein
VVRIALILLMAFACFAQDAAKPACNKRTSGQFWPAEANSDSKAARALSRCGALQICTLNGGWRYKWVAVSVHVSQFSAPDHKATAACLSPAAETKKDPSPPAGN